MSIFVLRRDGFPLVVWLGRNLDAPSEASESMIELAQSPPSATSNNESPCLVRALPTSTAPPPLSVTDNNGTQSRTARQLESESGLDVLGQTMTFETLKSC